MASTGKQGPGTVKDTGGEPAAGRYAGSWRHYRYVTAFLVAAVTFIVYVPALQNGFVDWDDGLYVYDNPHIRSLNRNFFRWAFFDFHAGNWHPLTWISHAIDFALWGLNPAGHHLSSVFLHSLCAFLVTLLAANLLAGRGRPAPVFATCAAAAAAGLLFGLHPLHVESAAWVSERKDLLCAVFYLFSVLFYMRYASELSDHKGLPGAAAGRPYAFYAASIFSFLLALLSKPMAITLPCVLLLLDWYPLERFRTGNAGRIVLEKVPFAALSSALIPVTMRAQNTSDAVLDPLNTLLYPLSDRIITGIYAIFSYLGKMVLPLDLIPFYVYPEKVSLLTARFGLPILALISATIFCIIVIKRQRIWAAVWVYYLVTLLPVLGIVKVGNQLMADRYAYLPSIGPFMLVSAAVYIYLSRISLKKAGHPGRRLWAPGVMAVCVTVLLAFLTIRQIGFWKNDKSLWGHEISVERAFAPAYQKIGYALQKEGRHLEALPMYEQALSIDPVNMAARAGYARASDALALESVKKGDFETALSYVVRALELNPKDGALYNTSGEVYFAKGAYGAALDNFEKAIALGPAAPERYYNAALSLERLGRNNEACRYWRQYLSAAGRPADAGEVLQHLRTMGCRPDDAQALNGPVKKRP